MPAFVADSGNRRILKIDLTGGTYIPLRIKDPTVVMSNPVDVSYDATDKRVYWTDLKNIHGVNEDGDFYRKEITIDSGRRYE